MAARDNLATIEAFLERFPERAKNDVYLAAESYGGHYIPQLAQLILNSASVVKFQFRGILVGNPYVSFSSGTVAGIRMLWGSQVVPLSSWEGEQFEFFL